MRFITYARVSTAQQESGTSLDSQEAATRALVEAQAGTVVAALREVVSGSLYLARSELQRAILMIERGEAEGVAMLDLERFARHAAYQEIAWERITRAGGTVLFVREQFDNTPEGRMMRTIRGAVTQYYREKQRILSMEGHAARALAGFMPQRNRPPYGYRIIQNRDVEAGHPGPAGTYETIAEQAVWVPRIFEWRAAGATLETIVERLIKGKAPNARGGHWQVGIVASILGNSVYRGEAAYGKTAVVVDETRLAQGRSHLLRRVRPQLEWIMIPAPALVSEQLWWRVQLQFRRGA